MPGRELLLQPRADGRGSGELMVREDLREVATRKDHYGVAIVAQLAVRLSGDVGSGHQYPELPRSNSGDKARLSLHSHGCRRRVALRFEGEVQLDRVRGGPRV